MENKNENNVVQKETVIEKHIPVERVVKEEVVKEKEVSLVSLKKSDDITELAKSLVKFHSELEGVDKTSTNPFFKNKYADLSAILSHIRPILSKHGLSIMQFPIDAGMGRVSIKTILLHESGQFMESDCIAIRPPKHSSQDFGGVQTYSRRYALSSILAISFDEDDDGNQVSQPTTTQTTTPRPTTGRVGRV